tara:strand:- start:102 stop:575 length:474 start_codon:yes stop_codon:yes gene_type:complete
MTRRRKADKRDILPDPKYGDLVVSKFINVLMLDGEKSTAENIVYGALDNVKSKIGQKDELNAFHDALNNIRPGIEVRSRRVGGATYQVPTEVKRDRGQSLAIRWIINASKQRSEKTMKDKLSAEIVEALNNRGNAVKKREDVHRMAEANKAFSHYKW